MHPLVHLELPTETKEGYKNKNRSSLGLITLGKLAWNARQGEHQKVYARCGKLITWMGIAVHVRGKGFNCTLYQLAT